MLNGINPAASMASNRRGFSLLELTVSLAILLIVSSVVMSGLMQMSYTQGTISNRSELHASVRSATELLQQEIGQAGRVSVPTGTTYTLAAAVPAANQGLSSSVALSSSSGSFPSLYTNEQLVVGAGADQETVTVTAYNSTTHIITAVFNNSTGQVSGAPVQVTGTFPTGVVPDTMTNGSTGSLLKLYGDINGDGSMVYVEYNCDTTAGKLYRNSMAYDAASKPALTDSQILLPNILANPDGSNCFTYQRKRVGASTTGSDDYVVNVAVTLTVQTEMVDPKTKQYQTETKALLNVSPRNVFEGWQLASAGVTTRIQPMPPSVTALLP
jgi:prepilin-type N-terminal cleavage/methylation domain-containing protein